MSGKSGSLPSQVVRDFQERGSNDVDQRETRSYTSQVCPDQARQGVRQELSWEAAFPDVDPDFGIHDHYRRSREGYQTPPKGCMLSGSLLHLMFQSGAAVLL